MFHVGAIIELIENDDLMNEEEEKVKFNKLSVLFHPKKKRKRDTHHRGEKSYRSCLPQNDAKETTEERCRPQKKNLKTAQTTTSTTTTTTKKKKKKTKKRVSLLTLQCGYFFAKRMATWEAIKPAPPVINTFFGSYGISLTTLSFFVMKFFQLLNFDLFFVRALCFLEEKIGFKLGKQRKSRLPPPLF